MQEPTTEPTPEPSAEPIARIRLARSLPRLLAPGVLLLVIGIGAGVAAFLLLPVPVSLAVVAAGALVALFGIVVVVRPLTIRLEVEEAAIRVRWLGGRETYPLAPGPVTRVRFTGPNASRLRARRHLGGWQLGSARLRDEEDINVVRIAPTPTAILVPTEYGRLAIAPAADDELLAALAEAAQARQRIEEAAVAAPPAAVEAVEPAEPPLPEPSALTGIERALLEERLAQELAEEEARREAERLAAEAAAAEEAAGSAPASSEVIVATEPAPTPRARARIPIRAPRPAAGLVILPTIAAGVAWFVGISQGRLPEPGTDLARLTSLALVLAGPATSVGAVMALAWWPRLVGIVVAGGVAAAVLIGRALVGA